MSTCPPYVFPHSFTPSQQTVAVAEQLVVVAGFVMLVIVVAGQGGGLGLADTSQTL